MIELTRMVGGRYRTAPWDMACITSGSTNTTPAKAAMAPAVLREMSPNPNAINANREMHKPVINTARSAPGVPNVAEGIPRPARMPSPRKNDAKLSSSQNTTVAAAVTPILAASRTGRLGVADNVARMVPLEYSAVMSNAPNTPPVSAAMTRPVSASWVASKPGSPGWYWTELVTSPVTNNPATAVTPRMMAVEGNVRIFTSSDLTACLTPECPVGAADWTTSDISLMPPCRQPRHRPTSRGGTPPRLG